MKCFFALYSLRIHVHTCRLRSNFSTYYNLFLSLYTLSLSLSIPLSLYIVQSLWLVCSRQERFVLSLYLHREYIRYLTKFVLIIYCCDDPRCRCILSFGLGCSQIGIGTMGSCRDFVPALFCSHGVTWVQLSWLHYGVLEFIGHGNDSKPGPSMARNRCYRLSHNTLSMFQIDYNTEYCVKKERNGF